MKVISLANKNLIINHLLKILF